MLGRAISSGSQHSSYRGSGPSADVVRALQDGQIDTAQLPADVDIGPTATIPLRDGTSRTLGDSSQDRILRTMLAAKAEAMRRRSDSPYGDASSYTYHSEPNRPHFKPGEPMIDPNPSSSRYDD